MIKINAQKAFSLTEVVVALAIIALLVGLGGYGFAIVQRSSRDEQRKTFLAEVRSAVDHYYLANSYYPPSDEFVFSPAGDLLTIGTKQFELVGFKHASSESNANSTKYYYEKDTRGYIVCALQESGSWLKLGDGAGTCM
ncbi:type II secretion system protein [Candidatus Dojkabacteria bacterium]|uniref:Type II secretion system protein n=1 Tax=Candidatus Dojkabacteria bacterium TaxID=2099670 RepID=A0A955KZE1_9BACT|nr:type II secretion system protein [Candidatus Dojkabacteria bacterium]